MSTVSIQNLFNFSRSLPKPFDTLTNKKVAVKSVYSDKTDATLSGSVLKAVNAVINCRLGKTEGAVGVMDNKSLAEYKSSNSADEFHIVVHDSATGNVLASVYNRATEITSVYVCNASQRDGAAIMMALFPKLIEDDEFRENFDKYFAEFQANFPDVDSAKKYAAILCDNAYRRIKDDKCSAHIQVNIDKSGNIMRVSKNVIDSGTYMPKKVLQGEFTIFAKTGRAVPITKAEILVEKSDFIGQYALSERNFLAEEKMLIPELPDWYVIPEEVLDICKHAKITTGKPSQMRNFLLRGPAGTGKTMGAQAIAAGLGLPYMKYTCSAGTEIYDFIGQIFPDSGNESDAILSENKGCGKSLTYDSIAKALNLPTLDDIDYDPESVYKSLTGNDNSSATPQDCMAIVIDKVLENAKSILGNNEVGGGQRFSYVETDLIKALKNGYVVEIQEPTTIVQPGVLVGLNSLLEQGGSITLPTGEVIKRHPDAVVIITTNVSYEGCRGMNQSIIDRMSLVRDVELPAPEVMVQRAMSVTGATDEYLVSQMVEVVNKMAEYCRKNGIGDGNVGMRSLIDWIESSEVTGDVYRSALYTVISKATSDEEDRETLKTSVLEPIFAAA